MEMLPASKLHATPQCGAVSAPLIDVREMSDVEQIQQLQGAWYLLMYLWRLNYIKFCPLDIYYTKLLHTDQRHVHMCSVRSKG